MACPIRRRMILAAPLALMARQARAGSVMPGVRQVIAALRGSHPADLSGWDLSRLDLAEIDLSGANLAGATLFGTDLTDAKLIGCNLTGANLDRAIIIRTDFTGATLVGARMFLPAASTHLGTNPGDEAPVFRRANLTGAHLLAHLGNADWTGAILTDTHFELGRTEFLAALRSDLGGCRFGAATLTGANLAGIGLAFADLRGANLARADLRGTDLAGARLDGANLSGAKLARADVHRATLRGVIGWDTAEGVDELRNLQGAER